MLVNPLRAADQVKRNGDYACDKHNQFGHSRLNRDRERNSTASGNPRDERQHDSENDQHNDCASDVETFIAQKDREGAAIKKQAGDENEIPGGSLRPDCNLHLLVGCNGASPWIQMSGLMFDFDFWRVFHMAKVATVLARCDFQSALKDVTHRVDIPEAAFARDHFHAVVTFFQPAASCFDPQALDKFCRRGLHFFAEDAREIAWTHRHVLCQ
jgi:hypothetical protein